MLDLLDRIIVVITVGIIFACITGIIFNHWQTRCEMLHDSSQN
jgi:hypothetical protein